MVKLPNARPIVLGFPDSVNVIVIYGDVTAALHICTTPTPPRPHQKKNVTQGSASVVYIMSRHQLEYLECCTFSMLLSLLSRT